MLVNSRLTATVKTLAPYICLVVAGVIGLVAQEGSKRGQQPSALDLAGRPMQEHVDYAQQLVSRLPECVRSAAEEPFGARAVVYSLLLDERDELGKIQLERLARSADPDVFRETIRLEPHVRRPA